MALTNIGMEAQVLTGLDTTGLSVPQAVYERQVQGWIMEAVSEADAFLRSQPGYDLIDECIRTVNGQALGPGSASLSTVSSNHFSKIALDLAAGLTDIKPFWQYQTRNKLYEDQARYFGYRSEHWWLNNYIDLRFMDAIKYSEVAGTGWTHHFYDPLKQDLDLIPENPKDVLPIRPASHYSIQDAFGVCIRRERPTQWLKARYPRVADRIRQDRDASFTKYQSTSRVGRLLTSMGMSQSPFWANLFAKKPSTDLAIPVTDVYYTYLADPLKNETSHEMYVGDFDDNKEPINNWSYVVEPGNPVYPRKRCIIATSSCIIYDGPSMYWHGMFPVNKLTLDPWPWTWLGKGLLWDILNMQRVLDSNYRGWDDHNGQVFQPGVTADKNSVSQPKLDRLNTRRAGWKIFQNPVAGKGITINYVPPLDPSVPQFIEKLEQQMDYLAGSKDIVGQLSGMGQIPSSETIEAMIAQMTPANRGRSRVMEAFIREFAMMTASNFMQFDTLPMRLAMFGPQGQTYQDFDFDTGSMVPAYLGDELDGNGIPLQDALTRGPRPRAERAIEFLKYFTFHVAPGSLLNSAQLEQKMIYMQLARMGYIDIWTLADKLGIEGMGVPPEGNIIDRLAKQAQLGIGMQANPAGRKASGQAPPRQVTKESQ